ncbi:ExeM/NucH family extracellular endonuclease [Deinococcus pimensis]|uniref:ExeM/NucH family extracellular endonuclease n=1 Tax=Deinococcus pimensis TaxID=309888 RepID=UPI0004B02692|nr:ExeM/NucH family extracellular endonuclease [Deinococcus pimensis]
MSIGRSRFLFSTLSLTLIIAGCGQQPAGDLRGRLPVTQGVSILSLPQQVKLVTLDVRGTDANTGADTRTYTATLENGVGKVTLSNVARGAYTITARGYDGTDDAKVVLYKATANVTVGDQPISLVMNRITSSIAVTATNLFDKANVVVAKANGVETRLVRNGSGATGTLVGVPTARNVLVTVEGYEGAALRQQGSATLALSETDASVNVALADVAGIAPATPVLTGATSVKKNVEYTLGVASTQDTSGGDTLKKLTVSWGDGSSENVDLTGGSDTRDLKHTFGAAGDQNVTVTVTNSAGITSQATLKVNVVDTATVPVTVDVGPEVSTMTLSVGGVPAGADRAYAVITPGGPIGAQDLKDSYTLELIPRGGLWTGTLGLPVGLKYTAVVHALTGTSDFTSATVNFQNDGSAQNVALTFQAGGSCPGGATVTPIPAVQGAGDASPLVGQTVTIRGVVTADFQSGLSGFTIQDVTGDQDPATSDAIFVYTGAAPQTVKVGDLVQLTGVVREYAPSGAKPGTLTQLDNVTGLVDCGAGAAIVPTVVTAPFSNLERYEGMLVRFADSLTVTETYGLGRYGELVLSASGRQFVPTNGTSTATAADNAANRVTLDDARSAQNPSPIPYLSGTGTDATRRSGDTVSGLTGVLHYANNVYKVEPTATPTFQTANPRPLAPKSVGQQGVLKVAGANVLNYFTTLGSAGRGASNQAEFDRQKAKTVAALKGLDADVVTLMEVENNGDTALTDLVTALNAAYGTSAYAPVLTGKIGTDAIKVAIIYKPSRVNLVGNYVVDTNAVYSRPPVAQTFQDKLSGGVFTVVANHLKSKGSCPDSATDPNADTGQGCWNALRVEQATALLGFVDRLKSSVADEDVLLMGDFNSYGDEDPIRKITSSGIVSENAKRIPAEDRYSYVFDGLFGYLDHALASSNLDRQVTGITEWHINADEPVVLDYNTEFKTDDRYAPTPFRASDHDPVLVGLGLDRDADRTLPALTATLTGASTATTGKAYTASVGSNRAESVTVDWGDGTASETVTGTSGTLTHAYASAGTYTLKARATAGTDTADAAPLTVTVTDAPAVTRGLVISQVYGAGGNANATYKNDYVELFNAGSTTVSLNGWSLQYASATGSFSSTNTFSFPAGLTVAPGHYFLVQLAAGTGTAALLPTPDATGTLAMGGSAGKVALVSATTAATGPTDPNVRDFVGYGSTANAFEGAGPTPAPASNAEALSRAGAGCIDTNSNANDFASAAASPRNSASPANVCN